MAVVALIARILLGIMFTVFGANGFLHFIPEPPSPPGLQADFMHAIFTSHFAYLIFGTQFVAGILLLIGRYVALALVLLGAVIANILTFHITMDPGGIALGIVALVLWIVVAFRYRAHLLPLVDSKTPA